VEARPEAVLTAPEARLVAVFYGLSADLVHEDETYQYALHCIDLSDVVVMW
jgi:hypothetical protein